MEKEHTTASYGGRSGNKGANRPGEHRCSTAGGPNSKRKSNKFGADRRNRKYLEQWERTAANKANNRRRQTRLAERRAA